MKIGILLNASILVLALVVPASADSTQGAAVPVFEPDYTLNWMGGIIQTDNRGAIPEVVDWDGDGVKDLLVGAFYDGFIFFYRNQGTNTAPLFQGRFQLEADGVQIALSYG